MKRRPSIGVKNSQQQTIFHNDETNIIGVKIYLNNELSPIMMRLPSIGVKNLNNKLSSIMTRLPFIRVTNLNNELSPIMTRLPFIIKIF